MSVIIRLQNLPWSADAHDIREFFKGLSIPEGGVHIVGGELGDAFIAFSSDEDARLAMRKTGSPLKGIQISLLLSSRSEMQKVIETARQQAMGLASYMAPTPSAPAAPSAPSQVTPQPVAQTQFHQPPPPPAPVLQTPSQRPQPTDDLSLHQNPPNPNMMYPERPNMQGQSFPQQNYGSPQSQVMPGQMPYQGQRLSSFPPGVVAPGMMPNQFFGQPPPGLSNSSSGMPSRLSNAAVPSPPATTPSFAPPTTQTYAPTTTQTYAPTPPTYAGTTAQTYGQSITQSSPNFLPSNQPLSQQPPSDAPANNSFGQEAPIDVDEKEKMPAPPSSSSRDKRDRDPKSRDDRRRHSKSRTRSRSRDRDRRRRHRTRSRSRSRDRSGRRKRSRSRERDRTRERDRHRSDREKGRSSHRDRPERPSQERMETKPKGSDIPGGIPGLGEIPDDIPKEGLSIFAAPSNEPVQSQDLPVSSGWPRRESPLPQSNSTPFEKGPHPDQLHQQQLAPPQPPGAGFGSAKPFLLANPATVTFGASPNPSMPNNPNASNLMGDPSNSRPFLDNNSPYFEGDNYGNQKEPLLQNLGENNSGISEEQRDWGPDSFDSRRLPRDENRSYRNQDHSRSDMRGGDLRGGDMRGGDIRGGDIRGGDMRGGDIRGGDIRGGDMRGGDMRGDIRGGHLRGGDMRGGHMRGADMRGDIRGDDMRRGDVRGGDPRGDPRGGDRAERPHNDWSRGSSWDSSKERDKGPLPHREDWSKPFSSRRDDDYNYSRGRESEPWGSGDGHHDRRDHQAPFSSRGGSSYQDDYNSPDYDNHFGRGGFRGRGGRRDAFGREPNRELDAPPRGGHGSFRDDEPPYRDRFHQDFDSGPRGRGGRGFMRGRGGRIPTSLSEYPRERRQKTCCVEVLNVPKDVSYRDIKDLFAGISLTNENIKILANQQGNRIGIALVQFSSTRDAYEGFKRSGQCIYDSRVQVNFIDEVIYRDSRDIREFEEVTVLSPERQDAELELISPCLFVSGLPVGCTDHDVGRVFESYEVEEIVLQLEKGSRQPSGGCFVRFSSPEEAKLALSKMDNPNVDGTPIKVEPCPVEPMEEAIKDMEKIRSNTKGPSYQPKTNNGNNPSEIGTKEHLKALNSNKKNTKKNQNSSENKQLEGTQSNNASDKNSNTNQEVSISADLLTDSVVVKNISSDITETSIRDFFSDEGLIPEKVYFNRPDSEGKSDVFVVFPKIGDAKRALDKNAQQLGSTTVTVELISKPMVMVAMGLPFNPLELFQKGQNESEIPSLPMRMPMPAPGSMMQTGLIQPQRNNQDGPHRSSSRFDPSPFRGRSNPNIFSRLNDAPYGGYRPRNPAAGFGGRKDHEDRKPFEERVISNGHEIIKMTEPPENFGKPGCVVALANVPFQATTDDILRFFKDFPEVQPENIIRRYDERNRPTSDSRVSLPTHSEAVRAVDTLNRKCMLNRPIHVSFVK